MPCIFLDAQISNLKTHFKVSKKKGLKAFKKRLQLTLFQSREQRQDLEIWEVSCCLVKLKAIGMR